MNVISRTQINEYIRQHPGAARWLQAWWRTSRKQEWRNLQELRGAFPSADQVGSCLVFNAPRAYRLIVGVRWATEDKNGTFFVKHFMSHAEYDKDDWKKDCAR